MVRSRIVEIAPFTLATNVSAAELISASRRVETDVLTGMEGYVGRILLQTDARSWTDMVFWRCKEAAEAMIEVAAASSICRSYFACMADPDPVQPGHGVSHHRIIQGYGGIDV